MVTARLAVGIGEPVLWGGVMVKSYQRKIGHARKR